MLKLEYYFFDRRRPKPVFTPIVKFGVRQYSEKNLRLLTIIEKT